MMTRRNAALRPYWRLIGGSTLLAAVLWTAQPAAGATPAPASVAGQPAPAPPAALVGAEPRALLGDTPVLASVAAQDLSSQATLEATRGQVEWSPAGSSTWQPVGRSQVVRVGDRIRTGPGGVARLTYFEGTVTDIASSTTLEVRQLGRSPGGNIVADLFQSVGSTVNRVTRLLDPSASFEVDTPTATAFIRGTIMGVDVQSNGDTGVSSYPDGSGGLITVRSNQPGGGSVNLTGGQQTNVNQGQQNPSGPTGTSGNPTPVPTAGTNLGGGGGGAGTTPPPTGLAPVIEPAAGSRVAQTRQPVIPPARVPPVVGPGTLAVVSAATDGVGVVSADLGADLRATVLVPTDAIAARAVRMTAPAPDAAPLIPPRPAGSTVAVAVDVFDVASGATIATPLTLGIRPAAGSDPTTVVVRSQVTGESRALPARVDPVTRLVQVDVPS